MTCKYGGKDLMPIPHQIGYCISGLVKESLRCYCAATTLTHVSRKLWNIYYDLLYLGFPGADTEVKDRIATIEALHDPATSD